MLGALSLVTEPGRIIWTGRFVAAMAWLVVVLSIGAVLLLLLLLRRGTASSVSSLFYLVPPATAVEAYLLFGERLAPLSVVGIVVAAVGVALVVRPVRGLSAVPEGTPAVCDSDEQDSSVQPSASPAATAGSG